MLFTQRFSGLLLVYIEPPEQTTPGLVQSGFFFPPVEAGIKIGRLKNTPPAGLFD